MCRPFIWYLCPVAIGYKNARFACSTFSLNRSSAVKYKTNVSSYPHHTFDSLITTASLPLLSLFTDISSFFVFGMNVLLFVLGIIPHQNPPRRHVVVHSQLGVL